MDNNEIILKPESVCFIHIDEDFDFEGTFKGYSSLCGETAMVLDVRGTKRFIPIAQIVYIDVKETPKSEDAPKKVDIYYR